MATNWQNEFIDAADVQLSSTRSIKFMVIMNGWNRTAWYGSTEVRDSNDNVVHAWDGNTISDLWYASGTPSNDTELELVLDLDAGQEYRFLHTTTSNYTQTGFRIINGSTELVQMDLSAYPGHDVNFSIPGSDPSTLPFGDVADALGGAVTPSATAVDLLANDWSAPSTIDFNRVQGDDDKLGVLVRMYEGSLPNGSPSGEYELPVATSDNGSLIASSEYKITENLSTLGSNEVLILVGLTRGESGVVKITGPNSTVISVNVLDKYPIPNALNSSINDVTFSGLVSPDDDRHHAMFNVNVDVGTGDSGKTLSTYRLSESETNVYAFTHYLNDASVSDTGMKIKVTHDGKDYWVVCGEQNYKAVPTTSDNILGSSGSITAAKIGLSSVDFGVNSPGHYVTVIDGPMWNKDDGLTYQGTMSFADDGTGYLSSSAKVFYLDPASPGLRYTVYKVTKGVDADGNPSYLFNGDVGLNLDFDASVEASTGNPSRYVQFDLSDPSLVGTEMRFSQYPGGKIPKPSERNAPLKILVSIENDAHTFKVEKLDGSYTPIDDLSDYVFTRERGYEFVALGDLSAKPFEIYKHNDAQRGVLTNNGESFVFTVGGMEADVSYLRYGDANNRASSYSSASEILVSVEYDFDNTFAPFEQYVLMYPEGSKFISYGGWDTNGNFSGKYDNDATASDALLNSLDGVYRTVSILLNESSPTNLYMYDNTGTITTVNSSISVSNRQDVSVSNVKVSNSELTFDLKKENDRPIMGTLAGVPLYVGKVSTTRAPIAYSQYKEPEKTHYLAVENPNDGQMYYVTSLDSIDTNGNSSIYYDDYQHILYSASMSSLYFANGRTSVEINYLLGSNKNENLQEGDTFVVFIDPASSWNGGYLPGQLGEANDVKFGEPGLSTNNIAFYTIQPGDLNDSLPPKPASGTEIFVHDAEFVDNRYLSVKLRRWDATSTSSTTQGITFMELSEAEPAVGEVTTRWAGSYEYVTEPRMWWFYDNGINGTGKKMYIKKVFSYFTSARASDQPYNTPFQSVPIPGPSDANNPLDLRYAYDLRHPYWGTTDPTYKGQFDLADNATYAVVYGITSRSGMMFTGFNDLGFLKDGGDFNLETGEINMRNMYQLFQTAGAQVPANAVNLYVGTGDFDTQAAEVGGQSLTEVDFNKIAYSVTTSISNSQLLNLLSNLRIALSIDDVADFDFSQPDRLDQVRTYQIAPGRSFDMNSIGDIGMNNATMSATFPISAGSDPVDLGNGLQVPMDFSNSADVKVAAALPKAIGAQMPLTEGKDEVFRIMVNESDFANLVKFSVKGLGGADVNGNTVTLQSLLRSVSGPNGDSILFSEVEDEYNKPVSQRKVGHEILASLFRKFPATKENLDNGIWEYDSNDYLRLAKLPATINLQFVLRTELSLKDSNGNEVMSTNASPDEKTSFDDDDYPTAAGAAKRVLILYNFLSQ